MTMSVNILTEKVKKKNDQRFENNKKKKILFDTRISANVRTRSRVLVMICYNNIVPYVRTLFFVIISVHTYIRRFCNVRTVSVCSESLFST